MRLHQAGAKQFRHPAVGAPQLVFHSFDLAAADQGKIVMTVYTAEPGTPNEDGLKLLASWAATHRPAASDTATTAVDNTGPGRGRLSARSATRSAP